MVGIFLLAIFLRMYFSNIVFTSKRYWMPVHKGASYTNQFLLNYYYFIQIASSANFIVLVTQLREELTLAMSQLRLRMHH
jgi:hypothetical protein